jgi:hypothetical protein
MWTAQAQIIINFVYHAFQKLSNNYNFIYKKLLINIKAIIKLEYSDFRNLDSPLPDTGCDDSTSADHPP